MNPTIGWALAALAVALGYVQWGWQGVALAVSGIVFWMLLQFTRVLRVMRMAAGAPVGYVDSAVMLQSRMKKGLRLLEILPMTRSLGKKVADNPETFVWTDNSGASVRVELVGGRCTAWHFERAPADGEAPPPAA